VPRQRKKAEFIIGSADDWKNVAEAEATCPSCGHDKAYYRSLQIRSADEPSTSFYRCSKPTCGHQWKED
jgi:DNA-directed RNA polymerase III subunit RPC11